ncbi:hypothetical protein C8F01DRAFT_1366404 [Mycena amicta]|nr:hypothetical protein C8F01DRAFT_1366404 [Mycena amicta]
MPILPKIFKRHRTTSALEDDAKERQTSAPSSFPSRANATGGSYLSLPVPIPDLRRGTSLPQFVVTNTTGNANMQMPLPEVLKVLPPTPTSEQEKEVTDGMDAIWTGIAERGGGSKTEKVLNEVNAVTTIVVNTESSSDGVVGFVKDVVANEDVQAFGKTILEGVPALMSALETLTDVHPFLKAAYLPFKLIYHQETERRENDQRRTKLFHTIKEVMLVLLDLKRFPKDDRRPTPDGTTVLGRMAQICKDLRKDIEECYNVLNTQEKRSLAIKFLKATVWNKELAGYATRFTTRRDELQFALNIRTAVTVDEMNKNMEKMMQIFATMMTSQERDVGRWIQQNGGEKSVLDSSTKCAALVQYESTLVVSSGSGAASRSKAGSALSEEEQKKTEQKAIATLRKEYREDIQAVIQENLETYSKRFEMGLDDMGKDLGKKIQHQGDRVISYLKGGPHSRIKDKMVYQIWREQGWKGSVKTQQLVLAIRDYFVERMERSKIPPPPRDIVTKARPTSTVPTVDHDEDEDDPDMSAPLPDEWVMLHLLPKNFKSLQQALDPDSSGFTTISEINAFTGARPTSWSFPRWICYRATGWQLSATRYCSEIERIWVEMFLLKREVIVKMPGNTRYIDAYIDATWQHVTALTSSIQRYDTMTESTDWLTEKFSEYDLAQEALFRERLEKIQYDIDDADTVSLVLRGARLEDSIFVLIALLMRRNLLKMHIALQQELDYRELDGDSATLVWVVNALWERFLELKDQLQHQDVRDLKGAFEWISCGLFNHYFEWNNTVSPKFFMENDMSTSMPVWFPSLVPASIQDPSKLVGILAYRGSEVNPLPATEVEVQGAEASTSGPETTLSDAIVPERSSPVPTVEAYTSDKISLYAPTVDQVDPPTSDELAITGLWYGFHWTDKQQPFLPMIRMDLRCGQRDFYQRTLVLFHGSGNAPAGYAWTLNGRLNSEGQLDGVRSISFERWFVDGTGSDIRYNGTYDANREIIYGSFSRDIADGQFILKKVPDPLVLCSRPLVPTLDAKQLWSYACTAVLNKIRHEKPGLGLIWRRMTDFRRTVLLIYRDDRDSLKEEDYIEYSRIMKTFTFERAKNLYDVYFWHSRGCDPHPAGMQCQNCQTSLIRSRVICMDCKSTDKDWPERTLDLCRKPECLAVAKIESRPDMPHDSSHVLIKIRDFFHLKDWYNYRSRAGYGISAALGMYTEPVPDQSLLVPIPPSPTMSASGAPELPDVQSPVPESASKTDLQPLAEERAVVATRTDAPQSLPPLEIARDDDKGATSDPPVVSDSESARLLSRPVTPYEGFVPYTVCLACSEQIALPAWYCLDCYGRWICDKCDSIIDEMDPWDVQKRYREEVQADSHCLSHLLIWVTPTTKSSEGGDAAVKSQTGEDGSRDEAKSLDDGWDAIEKRLQVLVNERFEAVDKRLEDLDTRLTAGLENIERLLTSLISQKSPVAG